MTLKKFWITSSITYKQSSLFFKNYLNLTKEILKKYHELGGTVIAGTDTPNPYVVPGDSIHQELELLVESGLTPMDALLSATKEASKILNKSELLGTIELGKEADMLLLNGNPLENISNTRLISMIFLKGVSYLPEEIYGQTEIVPHKKL